MRRDGRGAALVVVLGLVILLGVAASGLAREARLEASIVATLRARTVAQYAAESGIVAAEWRLETLLDSAQSTDERAALFRDRESWMADLADVPLGDARFTVSLVDLNARIDLNRSDPSVVRALLAQFTTESRAEDIAAAIAAAPVSRLGELMSIPGVDDALAAAVAPYVTVWGDGTINVGSAPEPVLEAIGEAASTTMVPSRLLVVSRGWREGHPLTHEVQAVYAVMGARLTLQEWQERDL